MTFPFAKKKKQQPGFNMGTIRGILKFESSVTPQEDLPKFALELNKHITANKKKKKGIFQAQYGNMLEDQLEPGE